jgi:hypothetical protein
VTILTIAQIYGLSGQSFKCLDIREMKQQEEEESHIMSNVKISILRQILLDLPDQSG